MSEVQTKAKPGERGNQRITVTIRTPAGTPHEFDVRTHDRVSKVTREAVDYFIGQNQLQAGNYGLAVVRDGRATAMTDSGRLEDYDVTDGETLALFTKDPQADG
jgi:hypothetical protein